MREIGLLIMLLLLSACGSKLSGEYADKTGTVSYTFGTGDKVFMSALGIESEGKYEIDGDRVKVENNGQNVVFTILEDGSIKTPFGNLKKKQ
ncbi:hypothetical protein [Methylotenera mobilis]|uniref:Uncharacterized protein n=1 Tax=Methylotenera mobilis (strain JLW8 / ATCC BAA-1282 / DSM 17540) TaxID=583345 RepID=C6WSN8_METML|nr:hypothetical protein [Methylotenera mobilis]ACT47130.1 hypothetical protein Mmol_0220 [Methylotenera mobilis JLW8]